MGRGGCVDLKRTILDLGDLFLALCTDLFLLEQRKTPSTLCALETNMLLAHPVPNHIVVSESPPALADLGSVAERCGVEVREDAKGDLWGEDGQEVDAEEWLKVVGEEGELGDTALGQEAAEDKLAMACWGRAEEGPDVRDNLLILAREQLDVL